MREHLHKLSLGTAQWGGNYGVANTTGQVHDSDVDAILDLAKANGITHLDTASAYGESESVVGRKCAGDKHWQIVSKIYRPDETELGHGKHVAQEMLDETEEHLNTCAPLYGLMSHRAVDIMGDDGEDVWACLLRAKEKGFTERLGVSVYDADEIFAVTDKYPIEIIQVPVNVFDQRLLKSGALERAKDKGIEIHVRSLFLQGLILNDPSAVPDKAHGLKPHVEKWHAACAEANTTPLAAALNYVLHLPCVDQAVVGVDTYGHFEEIISAVINDAPDIDYSGFAIDDPHLVEPRHWS